MDTQAIQSSGLLEWLDEPINPVTPEEAGIQLLDKMDE